MRGEKSSNFPSWSKWIKRLSIVGIVSLGFTANTVYADDSDLETIYHVYMNDTHVGVVDNQQVVQKYIDDVVAAKEEESEQDLTYTAGENVTMVEEKVFEPSTDRQEVIDFLDEELTVKVEATALKIDDEVVGYFPDQSTAEDVIQSYKEKFVDKEVLTRLDENSTDGDSTEEDQPEETNLQVGDSTIKDVKLSEKVSYDEAKVAKKKLVNQKEGLTLLEKGTLEEKKYEVQEGDVLGSIASDHDLNLDKLLELNPDLDEDSLLQIGDKINVTEVKPYVEVVVTEETMTEETIDYETEVKESDELYKGDEEVEQEGSNGKKKVHYKLEKVNGNTVKRKVVNETVTEEPTKEIVVKGTKVVPSRGSGDLQWPAVGGSITSHMGNRWGSYHKGIDISGVSNRSILAADNGTVVSAGWDDGGYGNKIVIDHNNGYRTTYAHLSSISVSAGQTVEKGQKIGTMGTTGYSTGVHLHFEVRNNGSLVNPADLL
ncbi:peptidase M23 family protein [Gracilibacillus halophilus YIM-C55.5]|uniref:Peptidase M23 family protein n=1 Tax=Gracilibacillus halophilus YIM-C55.5 TaxID=1308866 RepID=N4WRZ7_9BACI|nr:M23 family metallopeptidase [Gracilibacillus halophilus]ENH95956.1 peptidase M23 family protein [Gracilibacillus halophilus YIM-C55.5]